MHSLRLSDRTMSYDAGLNMYMHQKPPNQDCDDNDEANEADGTIIIDPHNGATIKGKSHRKISTGKKENYLHTYSSFPVISRGRTPQQLCYTILSYNTS